MSLDGNIERRSSQTPLSTYSINTVTNSKINNTSKKSAINLRKSTASQSKTRLVSFSIRQACWVHADAPEHRWWWHTVGCGSRGRKCGEFRFCSDGWRSCECSSWACDTRCWWLGREDLAMRMEPRILIALLEKLLNVVPIRSTYPLYLGWCQRC